ncbi:MAG: hypothetical protein ACWA6X_07620 [Bauldia sp.]
MSEGTASDLATPAGLAVPGQAPQEFRDANFQWYLSRARNTVYFAAYSPKRLSRDDFRRMTADIVGLAPQLNLRHDDRKQAHVDARPFDLDALITYSELPSFDGYPDKVVGPNHDLFEHRTLPNFRAACFVLPEGIVDESGNRTLVLFRASHALMEGVDTAQVLRGRPSNHRTPQSPKRRLWHRFTTGLVAAVAAPTNFIIEAVHWRRAPVGMRTLSFPKAPLKKIAADLGVNQRSVLFAIVMYGIYHTGAKSGRPPTRRRRVIGYSNLARERYAGDDDFVRLRMQVATMPYRKGFAAYVKELDGKLNKAGSRSLGLQMHYNAIMGIHRRIDRVAPFLYGPWFFSFVPYDFVLSLVPPHNPGGVFAHLGLNTVYAGSHTPGVNCCVIVPQGETVTLNVYGARPLLDRIDGIETLLSALGVVEPPLPP